MDVSTPLAPGFLVALDPLLDPHFARSVVLMLNHDEGRGAFGLVLNRSTDFPLTDLCQSLEIEWSGDGAARVDWGGPVQPEQGWIVFRDALEEIEDAEQVSPSLHWSGSRDVLRRVAGSPDVVARIFLGYAGWEPGQLEQEIAAGAWLMVPLDQPGAGGLVFDTPKDQLWTATVRSLGIEPGTLVSVQGVN